MTDSSKDSVRVIARFRPPNAHQAKTKGDRDDLQSFGLDFPNPSSVMIRLPNTAESRPYTLDRVYDNQTTQEKFFNEVAAATIHDVLTGYNGTIFAYGQTGSGKTHTMFGPKNADAPDRGLVPRTVYELFGGISKLEGVKDVTISCSFLEIYREQVKDLLNPKGTNLRVRETSSGETFVQNLTEEQITTPEDLLAIVHQGDKVRSVAATNMNETSSRSHSVLIIVVSQRMQDGSEKIGKLNLADLAGSERIGDTGASGQTLEEAKKINQSLSSLGNCINALTDSKRSHVPYRDSILTHILKDSLGGNTKTTLIICCSSDGYNANETVSTLKFGLRAKSVKNKVRVNRVRSVAELEALLNNLKGEFMSLNKHNTLLRALLVEMYLKGNITAENNPLILTPLPAVPTEAKSLVEDAIEFLRTGAKSHLKIPYDTDMNAKLQQNKKEGKGNNIESNSSSKTDSEQKNNNSGNTTASSIASTNDTVESSHNEPITNAFIEESKSDLSESTVSSEEFQLAIEQAKQEARDECLEETKRITTEHATQLAMVFQKSVSRMEASISAKDSEISAKTLEISSLTNAHREIIGEYEELAADQEQKIQLYQQDSEALKQRNAKLIAEFKTLTTEKNRQEAELLHVRVSLQNAESLLEELSNQLESEASKSDQTSLEIQRARESQSSNAQALAEMRNQLLFSTTHSAELESILETNLQEQIVVQNKCNAIESSLETHKKLLADVRRDRDDYCAIIDEIAKDKDAALETVEQLSSQNEVLLQDIKNLNERIVDIEERDATNVAENTGLAGRQNDLEYRLNIATNDVNKFREKHFQILKKGVFSKMKKDHVAVPTTLEECQKLIAQLQNDKEEAIDTALSMKETWEQYLDTSDLLAKKNSIIKKRIVLK